MGNNISIFTDIAAIGSYVSELGDVYYEKSIGSARFMKTLRGRHKDGHVVIKLYIKPESGMNLSKQVKQIKEESKTLTNVPNAFYFQRVLETDRATYLVRQYLYSSLYDRISIRPFLTIIEKKWIAYQLLRGIEDSHANKVYHGDIKTENVLVTTWNWVYLVDYAFYKPTYLPENNPADFSFFFDTSYRRTCYIAPERFYKSGTEIDQRMKLMPENSFKSEITPEMDIFSAGCVIAELFLEGTPLFTLSQLFKYRNNEYNPDISLEQIEDKHIRDMVRHMIQVDPLKRLSATEYLSKWHGTAFPHYFYSFLYPYMSSLNQKQKHKQPSQQIDSAIMSALSSAYPSINRSQKLTDADEKIERVFHDFQKIMHFVSCPKKLSSNKITTASILLPPTSNIPTFCPVNDNSEKTSIICKPEGKNTLYPSSKLKVLDILLTLSERLPDDAKLDRLVPYLIILLSDEVALVRANAIKVLTHVLCTVESISPINAHIFPEYIIPNIRPFSTDPDVLVRLTYASCIASLAETALRFLEMTQLLKADNIYSIQDMGSEDLDFESAYDSSLQDLQAVIQEQATILLIDPESSVKRALLANITCLCVFFGRQKANDVLLSHMITYLNDKDWMLRSAFFESIKGVGTFVGARSLEEYILPLMIQALTDAEEFVVEKVLNSFTSLADLGLFQKMKLWELIDIICPLICHPNGWIRHGAVGFISSAIKHLPKTDLWCIVYPTLRSFLRSDIADFDEESLFGSIETPLSRQVYEQAILWASKATSQSNFWKQSSQLSSLTSSKEDDLFLERLRSFGMSIEDEEKLRSMRKYIYKVSKTSRLKNEDQSLNRGEILLKSLNMTPMTVFLPDLSQKLRVKRVYSESSKQPMSIQREEDICKLNRIASQPHIQAMSSSIPIQHNSPTPSPSDYHFGSSLPKSLERSKSMMPDSVKNKNNPIIELNVLSKQIMGDNESLYNMSSTGYAHLQKLLYSIAMKAFPPHIPEFLGDTAVMKRIKKLTNNMTRTVSSYWKPEGTLVAHFTEHTAAINQLAISFDHLLFASCSDDGSVKIWDCSRLERNVTNRSRATYNQQGGRIKCITFIEQTYSIASASDNGSIHIFRVDIRNSGSAAFKFGKCIPVREYQLKDEYAILIKHFTSNASNMMVGSKSILLFATTKSTIYALDLMTMEIIWKLQNSKSHGVITAMITDPNNMWLLVGTMRGILTLYDLRFQIPLRSWLHPTKSRINALSLANHDKTWVRIASGRNEISVWDLKSLTCLEVFAVKSGDEKMTGVLLDSYKALKTPSNREILLYAFTNNESNLTENSIRAIAPSSGSHFMITGGMDRKIRYWDLSHVENSFTVLGLDIDEPKPRYSTNIFENMKFHFEFQQTNKNMNSTRTTLTQVGSTAVVQQQHLMQNHTDAITDIIITERPYMMIISGDRDGVIKIVS
ncbi:uncharacterized protein BX663DRAFT_555007 [Cokeromyces recurvatus]|uniref:uncharacterized protein n=1 Tax=Cokeromyces recurvatus TaxID=90255 RepID=UPI00221F0BF5|nr:uncharacterized protein BX663DRAFT_555007 [Cokeromyces recurvatus]KAI7899371.1 hypothetical protein BX663DRAFT_555007 [Cokeromyces recurvatus]